MEVPQTYTDTILIEANRKSSPEYLAGNDTSPNKWMNDCGSGIKLDVGDKISVHSAYISEIGNESSTIEIKGRVAMNNLNEGQQYSSSDTTKVKTLNVDGNQGDTLWEYTPTTQTNDIRDDTINLTHSYYKNSNGEYYITLPRTSAWNTEQDFTNCTEIWKQYNALLNGSVYSPSNYRCDSDYAKVTYFGTAAGESNGSELVDSNQGTRTELANDGSRYTIFVQKKIYNYKDGGELWGHRDPALFDYIWYKKTKPYTIKTGFNSPSNVAQSFTDQMDNVRTLTSEQQISATLQDKLNRNIDLVADSNTNEAFPCSFGRGFEYHNAYNYLNWLNEYAPVTHVLTVDTAAQMDGQFGGYYRNGIGFNSVSETQDLVEGMFVVAASDSQAQTLIGTEIIKVGTVKDPPGVAAVDPTAVPPTPYAVGDRAVFMNRTITADELTNAATITFGWTNTTSEYDYFYQSCYGSIGYKRPEIQETGRFLNTNYSRSIDGSWETGYTMTYPISDSSNTIPYLIPTTIPWTDDNLLLLKNHFAAQKKYPELFIYDDMTTSQQGLIIQTTNISTDKSRFIHLNTTKLEPEIVGTVGSGGAFGTNTAVLVSVAGLTKGMVLIDQSSEYLPMETSSISALRTYITKITGTTITFSQTIISAMNPGDLLTFTDNKLGNDNYYSFTTGSPAAALFIDFNSSREDSNDGFGYENPVPFESLRYGFAYQYENASYGNCIGFWTGGPHNDATEGVGGVDGDWFNDTGATQILEGRSIGFDCHFNAYGTAAIQMWNGLCGKFGNNYGLTKGFTGAYQDRNSIDGAPHYVTGAPVDTFQVEPYAPATMFNNSLMNEIYIGANDPQLSFNGSQSRFEFSSLHTPEVVGESSSSSETTTDAGTPCYKINKRLSRLNYSPNFIPYNNVDSILTPEVILMDRNIVPYSIMDAHGGIFFEDYGCDETNWRKSLWELLGFTYNQFHQEENNRLVRSTDLQITTSTPTTNSLIQTSDLSQWTKVWNASGTIQLIPHEPEKINFPQWAYYTYVPDLTDYFTYPALRGHQDFIEVVQNASSTTIVAANLPRKMISPIYLVKSDIIAPTYIGGQKGTSQMPVIAVVPKDAGYGDFYTGSQGEVFTNTQGRTIQNISVDICDADGSASRVDDSCCIVFRIQKEILSNKNVLQNILNPPKK